MRELAILRNNKNKTEKELTQKVEDVFGDPFKLGAQGEQVKEAFITFVCGHTYSNIETFSNRFGIGFDVLATRVGQFLSNVQRR